MLIGLSSCISPSFNRTKSRELAYLEYTGNGYEIQRCGERTKLGGALLMSNIDESFPEGSEAQAIARSAEAHSTRSLVLTVIGAAMSGVATALVVTADFDTFDNSLPDQAIAGIALAGGALIPTLIGALQAQGAIIRTLDAVNVYNEETFANPEGACKD